MDKHAVDPQTVGVPIDFDQLIALATSVSASSTAPVSVYPNPCQDVLFLDHLPVAHGAPTVEMLDATGRVVKHVVHLRGGISVVGLPSGMYVLRVWDGDQLLAQRRVLKR